MALTLTVNGMFQLAVVNVVVDVVEQLAVGVEPMMRVWLSALTRIVTLPAGAPREDDLEGVGDRQRARRAVPAESSATIMLVSAGARPGRPGSTMTSAESSSITKTGDARDGEVVVRVAVLRSSRPA